MPRTDGYSRYACDRKACGAVEYLQGTDPRTGSWKTVKRLTADGVEATLTLCPACYPGYKAVAEANDKSVNAYLEEAGQ